MNPKNFNKLFKKRAFLVYLSSILFCTLILYALIDIHIIKHDFYEKKFKEQSIGRIEIPSYRGRILDRNGIVLAYSLPSYSIAIRPNQIEMNRIPEIYSFLTENSIDIGTQKEFVDLVVKLREDNVPFYFIKRKFSNTIGKFSKINSFKGIEIIREPTGKRYYNFECMKDIIGIVDIDEKGIEGIELYLEQYESTIKGTNGYYELMFDALGNPNYNRVISYRPPIDGKDVKLSIDVILQQSIDVLARKKMTEHGASEVTIVVANKYGEILSCVSVDKEPNDFVIGGINKLYEPGSIFKIFTVVAALECGLSPKERFFSGPSIVIDGWTINNADDGLYTSGYENMEDILTYSFNVGTVTLMQKIGRKRFIQYLHKLGFYEYSGVEHPSDVKPLLGDLRDEPDIRFATISFGQGIAVTPLHILRLMVIIANGGYKVPLTFLKKSSISMKEKVLSDYTVKEIRKYLRSVVCKGTGKKAEVPGYYCAGKTGTAQMPSPDGGYSEGKYIASFVGFFPFFDPEYIIIVSVKEPKGMYYGGQVAAPIFRETVALIISHYNLKPYKEVQNKE
ncbi:MAG: penicillin-binding protein 2 [Candidatus Calescibacterium sp.]|nr:penicillin-binding protein 2 [Candidatus Calescibacterium sp.]MCX7971735.1 penicillin-binding protein 2 [bacterium]MDW8195341.1 penicillin-binding protein 2 [Candidatus Calescibacterium sp.]